VETTVVNIRNHPGWKTEGGVYIGRAFHGQQASMFANPFRIGRDGDRDEVIAKYRTWFYKQLWLPEFFGDLIELRGKMLVCWCKPLDGFNGRILCHGQIIAGFLDGIDPKDVF
jgi:hypothetical protein